MRNYWTAYVKRQGGIAATAARLATPYSTIAGITNGSRGIGRNLLERFCRADPELDPAQLAFVRSHSAPTRQSNVHPPTHLTQHVPAPTGENDRDDVSSRAVVPPA
jgi:hypothetical protein